MPKQTKSVVGLNKPRLFSPAVSRQVVERPGYVEGATLSDVADTNIESIESFRYDAPGSGLRSTQQLNVDWSRFENHTFFNSAVAKTNVAFDRIVNGFPFDGSRKEIEAFLDSLTGFEKYAYDRFPKYSGFLNFSGTQPGEDPAHSRAAGLGTYIQVKNSAGSEFPAFSKTTTGENILDFGSKSFSVEFDFYYPVEPNANQILCQRMSGTSHGFSLNILTSSNRNRARVHFTCQSGSDSILGVSAIFAKGRWNHVCATFDRSEGENRLYLDVGDEDQVRTSTTWEMDPINLGAKSLLIGSGTSHTTSSSDLFIPEQTFNGAINEFRFFHSVRDKEAQGLEKYTNIFAQDDLKLYFRLNEPTGTFNSQNVVLDYSGNSLHSRIANFSNALRVTGTLSSSLVSEDHKLAPILFPSHHKVSDLNISLLNSASIYDSVNPNLVTKLVPEHYLLEGRQADGLGSLDGTIGNPYDGSSIPGSGLLGSPQLLTSMLYVWSKFFDEIKIFVDSFSDLLYVDYDKIDNVPNQLILQAARYYGWDLPALYGNSAIEQFIDGKNLTIDQSISENSLQYIQSEIWRRILINLGEITRAKGTVYSVKAIMRAAGINPDTVFRIREYGGPSRTSLNNLRQSRFEVSSMIDFSSSLADRSSDNGAFPSEDVRNISGFSSISPFITSSFLSGTRYEVGYPEPQDNSFDNGSMNERASRGYKRGKIEDTHGKSIHGYSEVESDGLFTSGSWTYEGIYRFPKSRAYPLTQSLIRMHCTGALTGTSAASANASGYNALLFNVIAISGSQTGTLKLYGRAGHSIGDSDPCDLKVVPNLTMLLTGASIFDGNLWNISFGRNRGDDPSTDMIPGHSSSYFFRAARQSMGEIRESYVTTSYFQEVHHPTKRGVLQSTDPFNSGTFIAIGSQSIDRSQTGIGLNTILNTEKEITSTKFSGRAGHIRFWSKGLTMGEWKEHVRNFKSLGTEDPRKNFNFYSHETGSFERLRLDVSSDQILTASTGLGDVSLLDFSQNSCGFSGGGFEPSARFIVPEDFYYGMLSPKFDEGQSDNKVRIRGFLDKKNFDEFSYADYAPIGEIPRNAIPRDDTRFSIEYSIVNSLNEDMISLVSSLDFFDDALGSPNTMYSESYPQIDQIRKIYFERLVDKVNLKHFFEFFQWFDSSFTPLVEQVLPRKTKFLGINFVIEPHMFERSRIRYVSEGIFLTTAEKYGSDVIDNYDSVIEYTAEVSE